MFWPEKSRGQEPGGLQYMVSQRVGHGLATKLQQHEVPGTKPDTENEMVGSVGVWKLVVSESSNVLRTECFRGHLSACDWLPEHLRCSIKVDLTSQCQRATY